MKQLLTDPSIKNAKATDKTVTLKDGGGLFLYVEPNGSKRWRFRYEVDGKRNMLSLGIYPDVSLKEARQERDNLKDLIKQGINPSQKRKAEKTTPDGYHANSFEIIAREWFNENKPTWAAHHADKIINRLEKYAFAWIGKTPVDKLTAPEILAVVKRVKDQGILETAHRLLGNIGQALRYAVQTGRCDRDVTQDLRGVLPQPATNHMASLTEPKDVTSLLKSFDSFNGNFPVQCALKLAVLWFVRPNELLAAKWRDIDMERKEWRFMVSKVRTTSAPREHIVPLSNQAIAILEELQPLTGGGEYLFSLREGKPLSNGTLNKAIRRLGWGTQTEFTLHGARAMARTLLAERLEIDPHIIEHQLAHSVLNALGNAYNRAKYLKQRHEMMQQWADYLDELKAKENVIKMWA